MSGFPAACCNLPPVSAEYTPKGIYTEFAGLKSYAVGPEDAKSAIIMCYDVYGYSPQIIQGADLLASQGFRVIMPDFLLGDVMKKENMGPSEEAQKAKKAWFSKFPGEITSQSKPISNVLSALKSSGHSKVGAIGACWGYKVIVLSEAVNDFSAIATGHPSFIAADDCEKINVPLALLPSQGEDMSIVSWYSSCGEQLIGGNAQINKIYEGVEKKNPGKNMLKHFSDQPHGWTAARGDLKDPKGAEAFREAYTDFSNFFKAHL